MAISSSKTTTVSSVTSIEASSSRATSNASSSSKSRVSTSVSSSTGARSSSSSSTGSSSSTSSSSFSSSTSLSSSSSVSTTNSASTPATTLTSTTSSSSSTSISATPISSQTPPPAFTAVQPNRGAIVGGTVAAIALIAAVVVLYYWWYARRSRNVRQSEFARSSVLMNKSSFGHDPETARSSFLPGTAQFPEYQLVQTPHQTPQAHENPRFSYAPLSTEKSYAHPTYVPIPSSLSPLTDCHFAVSPPLPSCENASPPRAFNPSPSPPPSDFPPPLPPRSMSYNRDSIPDFDSTLYTHDKNELSTDVFPRTYSHSRAHSYSLSTPVSHSPEGSKTRRASYSSHIYAPLSQEEVPRIYGMPIPEIEIMDSDMNTYRKET